MNLRFNILSAAALAAATLYLAAPMPAARPLPRRSLSHPQDAAPMPSLAPMVKRVSPAVVNIATRGTIKEQPGSAIRCWMIRSSAASSTCRRTAKPRERQFQSAGSGVIVDAKNGYIITNYHVVENASEITVTLLDNRSFHGQGASAPTRAPTSRVLQAKQPNLVAMALGDSAQLEVGDYVVAIGNPFGLQHTVTAGIVSALGRSGINPEGYEDFIQTDASINPGNSGGALVNLRGELVGINSAILSGSGGNIGIGFAIPVNMVKGVMDQLIKYGQVKRGVLGVNIYDVTPDIAKEFGLTECERRAGRRRRAGLRRRDAPASRPATSSRRSTARDEGRRRSCATPSACCGSATRSKSACCATASRTRSRR